MARLHPGVYIEEVSSGVRPIEGVSTSTAAFIGKAEMGTLNKAVLVTSFQEFQTRYGAFLNDSSLAHAVFQFFNNGGTSCYLVRIAGSGVATADISIKDRKSPTPAKTLTIKAANEGAWGNKLDIVITDGSADPGNEFALGVFKDRSDLLPPLPPLPLESFDNLSMDDSASNFVEKVLAEKSKYISAVATAANKATATAGTSRSGQLPIGNAAAALKLGVPNGGTETAGVGATSGTSQSAAAPAPNPDADQRKLRINLDGDGAKDITIPLRATDGTAVTNEAAVAAEIQKAVRALTPSDPAKAAAYTGFTCTFNAAGSPNAFLLTSGTTGATSTVVVTNVPPPVYVTTENRFVIEVDGDGPHLVTLSGTLDTGANIALRIAAAVNAITPNRAANKLAFQNLACTYEKGTDHPNNPSLLLTSGTPAGATRPRSSVRVTDATSDNAARKLKLGQANGGLETKGSAILRPANSKDPTEYHLGDAVVEPTSNVESVTFGSDGNLPETAQYLAGLLTLDPVHDVSIVCTPGNGLRDVVSAGVSYCAKRGDCFFIGDTPMETDTMEEGQGYINSLPTKNSYGAVYFPWLQMPDPTGSSSLPVLVPPSGFMAGMYARIDAKRGVWKAPAGSEANVAGAVGLAADISDTQQDFLNPIGMNVIRTFPGSGIVVWGARTLGTRSDPEWRYIPVRRTAIFLEQSIYNGIQWAVFEPNDDDLWANLRLNIGSFMLVQFRAGAFQGKSPSEAFFVKCDNTTTTQADIDLGIVNILVGFAPLKPAEFVVLKFSQKTAQSQG
ncbi:MAG TPA: phage tail sheath subtilisin-like domain-containing protein [Blastocatellia bacterium]|nr:phage tail sheath subtilisin-like domain-containing protein [Blastocatellia bacterium]